MALCSEHHRLHHRGHLGIEGDADDPDGITFTDAKGRPLAPAGRPAPPSGPVPRGNWTHPTGEHLDPHCVVFSPPPGTTHATATITAAAVPSPASAWSDHPERDYPPFIDLDDPIYGLQDEPDEWCA